MKRYNKVYVAVPYNFATGGAELAHQLVDFLRNNNQQSYIVYYKDLSIVHTTSVTKEYSSYNIEVACFIDDSPDNILVIPEIYFNLIYEYININIGCWWMSVDNHYNLTSFRDMFNFQKGWYNKIRCIYYFLRGKTRNLISINEIKKQDHRVIHFYQSHYAQFHLYSNGFKRVLPLSDYINTSYLTTGFDDNREDIVLYNPKKGFKYTSQLINKAPHIKFVPLEGYTRDELIRLFQRAKLYIDFGNFPGKDRLPRESAINGCCIITGNQGASFFYEDLQIPLEYKFDLSKFDSNGVIAKITFVLENYNKVVHDFAGYRTSIQIEEEIFYREISQAFL